jgi:polysaccharide export outer membrane protein
VGIILVAGMTPVQLETEIATLIKKHELINEPSVRVRVEDSRAQPVYALGDVTAPGQFVITDEMYLLDLIGKAGGLLPTADGKAFLYRQRILRPRVETRVIDSSGDGGGSTAVVQPPIVTSPLSGADKTTIQIDLEALSEGRQPEMNFRLQGGDVLHVPRRRARDFFVVGDVKNPGTYSLPRQGTVTASQALAYAGGPLPTAKTANGFLMRHDQDGIRQAIPFDFSKVLDGKAKDIVVQKDDIIFIPSSNVKTIGIGLLNMMPRLLQQFLIF